MPKNPNIDHHVLRLSREPEIGTSPAGDAVVVAVRGECDRYHVADLRRALEDAARVADGALVVDLSETNFVDSSVLGALVSVNQELSGAGRRTIVVSGGPLRKIFEVTGLDLLFPVHASLEAALSGEANLTGRCVA